MQTSRTLAPRFAAVALASLLLLAVSACGGSDETSTSDTTAPVATVVDSTASTAPADNTALTDCLAEQGVDLPDGAFSGGGGPGAGGAPTGDGTRPSLPDGIDPGAIQDAMTACADFLPDGAGGAPGGFGDIDPEALRVYTSCLSDHGVDLPDLGAGFPDNPGDGTLPADPPADPPTAPTLDTSDPDTAAALDTCAPLLPDGFDPAAGPSAPTTEVPS